MSLAAAQTQPSGHGRIPVLDIGAYLAGEAGSAAPLARAIARACEDTGFLVVANHGVPQHLVDDTFAVAAAILRAPRRGQARAQGRQVQHRLPAVRRAGRAPFAGQQEHQAEFQRELLHHPRPRPRPPRHRQRQAAGQAEPLARGHARAPRRDDRVLPGDGGDDDAARAAVRAGTRSTGRLFRRRPSPSRAARSG